MIQIIYLNGHKVFHWLNIKIDLVKKLNYLYNIYICIYIFKSKNVSQL